MRFLLLLLAQSACGFTTTFVTQLSTLSRLSLSSGENFRADYVPEDSSATTARIESLVKDNKIVLFMKGSKMFPQCGFSNTAVQILSTFADNGIDFETVDVLADEQIRAGIKDYSAWPTIPQLYVGGEFVGGCDIMIEEYQNGNLAETIEKACAS